MITIFGTTYFTIGAGLIVLALAAPFLLWFSVWLLRPNIEDKPRSTRWLAIGGTTLALLLLIAVGLFWDVYLIGQRAKELCADSGLRVHRQVVSDSFVGSADIAQWSRHGFNYVETDFFGTKHRHELIEGRPQKTQIAELSSEYRIELVDLPIQQETTIVDYLIRQRGARIIELATAETVAELTEFSIRHGWLDRSVARLTGFVVNTHTCGKTPSGVLSFSMKRANTEDLILATMKPN